MICKSQPMIPSCPSGTTGVYRLLLEGVHPRSPGHLVIHSLDSNHKTLSLRKCRKAYNLTVPLHLHLHDLVVLDVVGFVRVKAKQHFCLFAVEAKHGPIPAKVGYIVEPDEYPRL